MRIYTRTGDDGETTLVSGPSRPKDDARVEACGTVDELNTALGLARVEALSDEIDRVLTRVQHDLFAIGAELGRPFPAPGEPLYVQDGDVAALEAAIDWHEQRLPPLSEFILPGGVKAAAAIHWARAVCRRAERRVVTLARCPHEEVSSAVLCYLNRLSDLLFVLSRAANAAAGRPDVAWRKPVPP